MSRRRASALLFVLVILACGTPFPLSAASSLPFSTVFKGEKIFHQVVDKAQRENWRALPIGERISRFAMEFHGVPYKSFTLEIDDKIEAPSANLLGMDCWTFFEICLGLARMLEQDKPAYTPRDLLSEIEFTRYRTGGCRGNYLDRIHYLAEWFFENEARGVAEDITRELGGAQRVHGREIREMSLLWKSYRYLRATPQLLPVMAKHEAEVARLPVYYIPKNKVASIESKLRNGDILGVVTNQSGGFCSHVGLAVRTKDGVMRIMHASTNYKRVVVDKSVSGYLNSFKNHAGIIVGRPLDTSHTVRDYAEYQRNLKKLTKR